MNIVLYIYILILLISFIILILVKKKNKLKDNISEWSYQRYAKFYGNTELKDLDFTFKINSILDMILNKGITNLEDIATTSHCTFDECILKIKYLKNKRLIGDYYIDLDNKEIKKCNSEDEALLKKYSRYIYTLHSTLEEIANGLPYATLDKIEEVKNKVLSELSYLDKKGLINGVNIDLVDKKIIYYSVEKHKTERDYISINCDKCSALIDVPRNGKARCEYCDNIVEDKSTLNS